MFGVVSPTLGDGVAAACIIARSSPSLPRALALMTPFGGIVGVPIVPPAAAMASVIILMHKACVSQSIHLDTPTAFTGRYGVHR